MTSASERDTRPRPGMRLGRYQLLGRIGSGGMAEVFLARQEGPEGFARRVAIKFVHPDRDDPELLRSLIDEARVAAWLHHPGIVQVLDLDRFGDGFYMVMEYLDGLPLDRLARLARNREQPPDLPAIVDLGVQLLDALAYAHGARDEAGRELRVVHRDVKPSNVIVDGLGLARIVDFGIARAESLERRTATGLGKGTPAYMAPEQLRGEEVGAATDLFAVGVVLAELALGRPLFSADNLMALLARRTLGFGEDDRADLLRTMPELLPVIVRALADAPQDRFAGAETMAAALREISAAPARQALHAWMSRVVGGDPAAFFVGTAATGSTPTRVASADLRFLPSEVQGGTRVVPPDQGAAGESERVGGTGVAVAAGPRAGPGDGPGATVLAPSRRGRIPTPAASRGLAVVGLGLLVAGLLAVLAIPGRERERNRQPAHEDQVLQVDVEVPPRLGTATPEGSEAGRGAGARGSEDSEPGSPAATPAARPGPPATPALAGTAPSPAPVQTTPQPKEVSGDAGASLASGALAVGLAGVGGMVDVAGHGSRPAPTGEMRLPPGVHRVRLLDLHGDLLLAVDVEIRSGETNRCAWRDGGGGLVQVPDPKGAPCRVR